MSTGEECFAKATGKINRLLFNDWEGAQELFLKAGAMFKADKEWSRAGEAYMKAGDICMKLKSPGEACQAYTECANSFKKVDMSRANVAMEAAIRLNIENNRLGAAARMLKEWGDALEAEGRGEEAIPHYKKAQQYFDAEDQTTSSTQCIGKMAKIYGDLKKWREATQLFEAIGRKYAEGAMKHQAREQFFRAMLCQLCLVTRDNLIETIEVAKDNLTVYAGIDLYFGRSREFEVCELLIGALENSDEDLYGRALGQMESLNMLDDFKTGVMHTISANVGSTD